MDSKLDLSTPEALAEQVDHLNDTDLEAAVVRRGLEDALDEVFGAMATRFLPERTGGQRAVIQWDVHVAGTTHTYGLTLDGAHCSVAKGPASDPRVTLGTDLPAFLRIVAGRLSGLQAFSTGRLQVSGDRVLALRQQMWFDADLSQARIEISTPSELARLIEGRTDEEIEAGVALNGIDRTLEKVFHGMVEHFRPEQASRKRSVVEFHIRSAEGNRTYQFVAAPAGAAYHTGSREKSNVRIHVRFPDFLRMVAGKLHGIKAFTQGRVKVRGNLLLARKIQDWFDMGR